VPPIYDKQRITAMDVLQKLWNAAQGAIERADRIVFLGYSMPDGDVLARQMMRRAYSKNSNSLPIDCINPDPMVAVKLKGSLNARVVRFYAGIPDFMSR
jgi:hypothetical protein